MALAMRVASLEVDLDEVFPVGAVDDAADVNGDEPDDDEIRERWWSFDGASA